MSIGHCLDHERRRKQFNWETRDQVGGSWQCARQAWMGNVRALWLFMPRASLQLWFPLPGGIVIEVDCIVSTCWIGQLFFQRAICVASGQNYDISSKSTFESSKFEFVWPAGHGMEFQPRRWYFRWRWKCLKPVWSDLQVHVKEFEGVEIFGASLYGVSHDYIVVLGC